MMTGSLVGSGSGKAVIGAAPAAAPGSPRGPMTPQPPMAADGSGDDVEALMGRLRLTAAETTAVVLDEGTEAYTAHSKWTLVG